MILPIEKKRRVVTVILVLLLSTFAIAEIDTLAVWYDDKITYSADASGDIFLMRSGGTITLVYSGNQRKDAAWFITDYLSGIGITYVDNLLLPNYTYLTSEFCQSTLAGIKVKRLIIPVPKTDDEIGQAEALSDLLSFSGADLIFTKDGETLKFGEYTYRSYNRNAYKYGEYPENAFEIEADTNKYVYVSACKYEELNAETTMLLFNCENLFIGTVGNSKYYLFNMRLPSLERIYYGDEGRLEYDAEQFYKNKGASTHYVKTPVDIHD